MNSLNISKQHFGTLKIKNLSYNFYVNPNVCLIYNAYLIYNAFKISKYILKYDLKNKRIVVLRSSNLSNKIVDKMLYKSNFSSKYYGLFPKVKKKRDSNGNLLIKFIYFHPHQNNESNIFINPNYVYKPTKSFCIHEIPRELEKGKVSSGEKIPKLNNEYNCFLFPPSSNSKFLITHKRKNPYKKKIQSSSEFGNIIKNPDLLFHGINFQIWKIPLILEHGILSLNAAYEKDFFLGLNYGSKNEPAFNGKIWISCSRSPVHEDSVGYEKGAFGIYIKDGLSFVIKDMESISNYKLPKKYNSKIKGESLVSYRIPLSKIIGIMGPKKILKKKLSEINFMEKGALNTFHIRCQSFLKFLKKEFEIENNILNKKVQKQIKENDKKNIEFECNQLFLTCLSKKFPNLEKITLYDFIKSKIPTSMKIYDNKGFEIMDF